MRCLIAEAIARFVEAEGLDLIGENVEVETGKCANALDLVALQVPFIVSELGADTDPFMLPVARELQAAEVMTTWAIA